VCLNPEYTSAYIGSEGITSTYTISILSFAILLLLVIYNSIEAYKKQTQSWLRMSLIPASYMLLFVTICAFNKKRESIDDFIPKTSTGFIDSAFSVYKPSITTRWDERYFYIASRGIPTHPMMVGITSWQQQVPLHQDYTGNNSWSIPLQPVYAEMPLSTKTNFMKGAIAIAVNGVPIFNALNNRGEDALLSGELDNWGGHCGRADDYHYHAAPLHLSASSKLMPIAFALDGFAVYGNKEPDGTPMKPLDACNGHVLANGVYHYHGTTSYPYVIGAMKGKVTTDAKTPAPENQILPQAFASPLRPPGRPLRGAAITAFSSPDTNTYLLNYKLGDKNGSVKYSWDNAGNYIFWFGDADGNTTSSDYQKRKNKQ
jgi:hypothetical protein